MESYENRDARFEETRLRNAIETGTRQPSARAPAALATRTPSSRSNEMEKKISFLTRSRTPFRYRFVGASTYAPTPAHLGFSFTPIRISYSTDKENGLVVFAIPVVTQPCASSFAAFVLPKKREKKQGEPRARGARSTRTHPPTELTRLYGHSDSPPRSHPLSFAFVSHSSLGVRRMRRFQDRGRTARRLGPQMLTRKGDSAR